MRPSPAADQPPRLLECARGVLVAAMVEVSEVLRQPEQEAQLLEAEVRGIQMAPPVAGVRRLDQALQHVERRRLQPIPEQVLLPPRELLHRGHQPQHEAVHRLQRRPRSPRVALRPTCFCHYRDRWGAKPPRPPKK